MKKVVMNKNFVEKYFYRAISKLINEDQYTLGTGYSTEGYSYYSDLSTLTTSYDDVKYLNPSLQKIINEMRNNFWGLCNDEFITLIDMINSSDIENRHLVIQALIVKDTGTARDKILSDLVSLGYITEEFKNSVKFYGIDAVPYMTKTISGNDMTFNLSTPTKLTIPVTDGSANNMIIFPYYTTRFSMNETTGIAVFFYSYFYDQYVYQTGVTFDKEGTLKKVTPYISFSMSETDGDGDIKYDHLDKITHLDNIKFTISLPKEIVLQY